MLVTPRGSIYARQWVLASIESGEVSEISKVVVVPLLLGRKQRSFVHGTIVLFTLHTLLKAVIRCLQLNTGGGSDDNLKVDYQSYMQLDGRLYIFFVLPNQISQDRECLVLHCYALICPVNCPAVIYLPSMLCVYLKENTSSELWTLVQSLPLIYLPLLLFTFCKPPLPSTPYV